MQIELVNQDLFISETEVTEAPETYPVLKDGDVIKAVTYFHIIPLEE